MAENLGNFKIGFEVDTNAAQAKIEELTAKIEKWRAAIEKQTSPAVINSINLEIQRAQRSIDQLSASMEKNTATTYNNFRAIGQADRITREFAAGGLTQGLNGLTMFGNSLTRIAAQEGGFKNAIAGLGAAFTGPAGIVLGLSAVVGLIEANKDKITEFFKGAATSADVYKEVVNKIGDEFTSALTKTEKVKNAFDEYHRGIITGQKALEIYNNELGKVFGTKKDINEAEKVFAQKTPYYIEAVFQRALADAAAKEMAQKTLDLRLTQAKNPNEYVSALPAGGLELTRQQILDNAKKLQDKDIAQKQAYVDKLKDIFKQASAASELYQNAAKIDLDKTEVKTKQFHQKIIKPAFDEDAEMALWMANENAKQNRALGIDKLGEARTTGTKGLFGDETDFNKPASKQQFEDGMKAYQKMREEQAKVLKDAAAAEKRFAETLATDATNALRGIFNDLKNGKSLIDALGDSFLKLAEDIGFAIIKQQILNSLMKVMNIANPTESTSTQETSSFNIGSILGLVGSIFGFADGGIVSRPTLSMVGEGGESEAIMPLSKLGNLVTNSFNAGSNYGGGSSNSGQFVLRGNDLVLAMQRSNYSLNLRRGS